VFVVLLTPDFPFDFDPPSFISHPPVLQAFLSENGAGEDAPGPKLYASQVVSE